MTAPGAHAIKKIGMLPSDGWRFGFAFNKSFHNSLFWSWCQRSVFVLKRWSLVLIQYKESRHMAGNSPTADIRRWWDRLSPQWEFLSQLGILILLGQHFDIDQDLGMTCMKTIKKKDKVVLKAYESMKSHWSCWTVLWHKIVLIIQSRFYFCRQNILFALNFEKRILEHIDVNIDHICHFQSIDLQVYFLPKIIFVKLISSMKKNNPVACFTHALPDHRQQHPDEFCHIFTEIDEIVIMIKINKWIIVWI